MTCGNDWDDSDPTICPDCPEICGDGKDNDQDGSTDCADNDCLSDKDGDGHNPSPCGNDWDDNDPTICPGCPEICSDGKDNDQDGNADCSDSDCLVDGDGDGHYDSPCGDDWDDDDPTVYPGAPEICDDGKDNDQDGNADCYDSDCQVDNDSDGYYDAPCGNDWDDNDPDVYPGAPEICDDGKDNDQDGSTDCDDGDCLVDGDSDGHYDAPCGNDWDDSDPDVYPGAPEICDDGKDNDQDGSTDCDDGDGCITTDIDGNTYQAIQIGSQCWMIENLKVTRYRNGDLIPNITDNTEWSNLTTGAYCNYSNNVDNVATYGRLYNWYSVNDSRNIAPEGWHVPSDAEWTTLTSYLGGFLAAGGKMKEVGFTHWITPNTGATNESGFTALPGGYRLNDGSYNYLGQYAYFWSSSQESSFNAWNRLLSFDNSEVSRDDRTMKNGYSIRCIKD